MIQKIKFILQPLLLPAISGVLIGTSYTPFPPWASLFCFLPLWLSVWNESSYKKVFLKGLTTQFILSLIGFHWVTVVATEHGHLPFALSIVVLIIFSLSAMYYFPLSLLIWKWLDKKYSPSHMIKALLIAVIFSLLEVYSQTIFPWNFGYSFLSAKWPIYQLADITGFQGLSTYVLLSNAFLLIAYKLKKPIVLIGTLGVFLALNIIGHIHRPELSPTERYLNLAVIQANVGNQEKFYAQHKARFQQVILDKYLGLSERQLKQNPNIDALVWPETAIPVMMRPTHLQTYYPSQILNLLKTYNVDLFSGAFYEKQYGEKTSNSFIWLNEKTIKYVYKKTHLLAFGEYLPFSKYFPKLKELLPQVADFERGQGPKVFNYKNTKIGLQICYEGLFPDFSTELAQKGVELIINLTNDSWYGDSSEPHQHLTMTLARAIEHRTPLLRSTNTGISTLILANGEVKERSPIYKQWAHVFKIPIRDPQKTFFQKFSWLNTVFLVLLMIGLITAIRYKGNYDKKTNT